MSGEPKGGDWEVREAKWGEFTYRCARVKDVVRAAGQPLSAVHVLWEWSSWSAPVDDRDRGVSDGASFDLACERAQRDAKFQIDESKRRTHVAVVVAEGNVAEDARRRQEWADEVRRLDRAHEGEDR